MEMSLDSVPWLLQFNNHLFALIVITLLFFVAKACFHKSSLSRFRETRLPPGPKPLPVLGNMHQLAGSQPVHVVLHELAKTYGPICHLKVGGITLISVTSSEVAKEILKTQELRFAQRPKLPVLEMTRFDHGSVAFAPYGEYWRKIRKICVMELFNPRQVRCFRSLREQEIGNLIGFVERTSRLPFNVSEMIVMTANNIISKALFGKSCKRQDELMSVLMKQLNLAGQFSVPEVFPSLQFLYHLNGTKAKMSSSQAVYDDILGSVIADRRIRAKSLDHSSYEENLIDVLLRLQESGETGISLTDNTIKDIIMDMFIGGTDTSPTAVEWALSEMLKNPGIMKKAQTELRNALKGKAILEEADLEELQYLKLIIKEIFRLHPPATLLARAPGESCVVHGYDIPKASRVIINTWSLGRDPNRWENPEKFEPERFLGSSINLVGTNFELLPFGSGRRSCPGSGFAVANIELMLANLIYYFDWKPANGQSPDKLDMAEAKGMVVKRLHPLFVVATPYHPIP